MTTDGVAARATSLWQVSVRLGVGSVDLDVDIEGDGGTLALVGPNACGKTTVLRTIGGAHRPLDGQIRVGERVFFDSERGIDLPPERRRVGYVPQGYRLFPHLKVVENVAFALRARQPGASANERRSAALGLLEELECEHLAERWPTMLSGGEQQRVALARALMIEPEILLLDEPLAALDAHARRTLRGHLAERLRGRAKPAVVVTHDARDIVALQAKVCVLEEGRIVQTGWPEAVAAAPATEFVAELFGA